MECTIIADSSCDMTPELRARLGVVTIPFTLMLGEREYVDDENLDIFGFIDDMRACTEKSGSAAPSPLLYQEAMEKAVNSFVVTISSRLSASYSNAVLGGTSAQKDGKCQTHVFDSKSAVAAELLIAIKIRELLHIGMPRDKIIQSVTNFINSMKTYFVLERYENLLRNGRLNKLTGRLINVLNIKLIMGADCNGEIAMYAKARGANRAIEKMAALIKDSGRKTEGENLVIAHCDNLSAAEQLRAEVEKLYSFKEIFVVQMRGLSSFYSDYKGLVMAF